ncbi:DNA repair protein [Fistulina hepatica ATCC 64428]|uniref:DNA repair protein REV1 n=1 Tax=Fistulina hepatica ATCC 64428 TaxID=1128425 RepID=A0A0D7AHL1_9AGAR|nr:DNA repair protein [Fistulina hepatica ATCC 64428]
MPSQLSVTSSDYFESDDPEFLEALQNTVLPGDLPSTPQIPQKRVREDDKSDGGHEPQEVDVVQYATEDYDTYGPSRFGQFGEYMHRKRAKLQIQNTDILQADAPLSTIFNGISIYINGWTEPSVQDLRRLVVQHGGTFQPYLDKKSLVTHIVTCSLTPSKTVEFKHMKVVRPDWLVQSVAAGTLLPWQNFIFHAEDKSDAIQEARTIQRTLSDIIKKGHTRQGPMSIGTLELLDKPDRSSASAHKPAESASNPEGFNIPVIASNESRRPVPESALCYAINRTNPFAERVMADPEWRKAHTAVAPDFIEGFYKNSRLHHLSTWKAELKLLVQEAQRHAESGFFDGDSGRKVTSEHVDSVDCSMKHAEFVLKSPSKNKGKARPIDDNERVIMHCDFDSFFVAAGLIDRPHLRGKAVVVCHSQGSQGGASSTSEIASASYEARKFGIRNGMSLQQARRLCPEVATMPYEFERYKQFSLKFYTILMRRADDLQAVSVDEALIDVSGSVALLRAKQALEHASPDPAHDLAESIRAEVRSATGCEISIGISHNILLARVATRRAKPAGSYHLLQDNIEEHMRDLEITDLHGFGWSQRQKAIEKLGTTCLGDLVGKSKSVLCDALGKMMGETLYNAIRGVDNRKLESDKPRKSVSCDINYGIRFETSDQAEVFIRRMASEVARRLREVSMLGRSITLKVMKRDPTAPEEPPKFMGHGACDVFNKQMPLLGALGQATADELAIGDHAWKLLRSFNFDPKELRGLGIQIQKLEPEVAVLPAGQSKLSFKPVPKNTTSRTKTPIVQETTATLKTGLATAAGQVQRHDEPDVDLPTFSQVDKDVFNALPPEVREELQNEYKRRSESPAVVGDGSLLRRSATPGLSGLQFPQKTMGTNMKRITQQLAPRNQPALSPRKTGLLTGNRGSVVNVSDTELQKLQIDPAVFAMLPDSVKREQIVMARLVKSRGTVPEVPEGPRKTLRPAQRRVTRSPSRPSVYAPAPKAKYAQPAVLRQQGRDNQTLQFTEADDIQTVIETWVDGYRNWAPKDRDVEFFKKFLLKSVDFSVAGDTGVETAISSMKWWLVLLRRHWGAHEHAIEANGQSKEQAVGVAWWRAFRSVKDEMDFVARQRFGGHLAI